MSTDRFGREAGPARNRKSWQYYPLSGSRAVQNAVNLIESYNPDGLLFADKNANDNCDYDSDANGSLDRNWATEWQAAHPGQWYDCPVAHSQPVNGNLKAYAAWWLWARLAGWDGK